jgi:membrane protease YdiL (CAAX protease family)
LEKMMKIKDLLKKLGKRIKNRLIKTLKKILQIPVYLLSLVGAALITAAIMIPLGYGVEFYMQWIGINMTPPVIPESPFDYMTSFEVAIAMFAVGVFEEVYFRYLVMDCLLEKWAELGPTIALLLSSVMFGMAHLANAGYPYSMPQAIAATGAGLWFAYLYRKKGLHFAIFTHAIYNTGVVVIWPLLS